MNIQPKIRGFICTTAHPVGCEEKVKEQIDYVNTQAALSGPKRVLVIGASTGYGLASRIVATFGMQAKTIGVFFEKEAGDRTASAGWYNSAAFEKMALAQGYYAKSINGDAFSDEIKAQTAALIRQDFSEVDLVIYSLASPRRCHPQTQEVFSSALKPIGHPFTGKTVDAFRGEVKEVSIPPATEAEIAGTIAVMGGEDWAMWMEYLSKEKLLAQGVRTIAYSYIGPSLTHAIYKEGTIGKAKEHLKSTADQLNQLLTAVQGQAVVSVNKALVTQASAAIPVVPLYISLLYKVMKEQGTHEGCIQQIYRLFKDYLCAKQPKFVDAQGYWRVDDWEMDAAVQEKITALWPMIDTEHLEALTDIEGYREEFYQLFGFKVPQVDYEADVNPIVAIPSLEPSFS